MKDQILNWLKSDRSFNSAVALYQKFCVSLSLKAILNRQSAPPYNAGLLTEELTCPPENLLQLSVLIRRRSEFKILDGEGQQARFTLKGLYKVFWKDWLDWRKTSRQVELTKLFTPVELFALDFTKKYRALNTNFVLDEVNFTVTNDAIKPAKVKAWTV
ncbi:MAG: hypothetical protein NTU44_00135 [Bacteroidetes bacterium]|nr:hypothetical protein [Bacteroidota bacterium]